jgi:hypothetical protein
MAKAEDFVNSVLLKAREGKLNWSQLSPASFAAPVGNNSIAIERRSGDTYKMDIMNSEGRAIASFLHDSAASLEAMKDIYNLARRKALRVDETISEILSDLENL